MEKRGEPKEQKPIFTLNSLLKQAYKIKGELAHYHDKSVADSYHTRLHCIHGEVPFTYSLVRLGYDILVDENPRKVILGDYIEPFEISDVGSNSKTILSVLLNKIIGK